MQLNLPEYDIRLRRDNEGRLQVFDRLRDKFVALTPEEWVRQNFVEFLINSLGYPPHRMANEVGLCYNNIRRRCDTVVYDAYARPAAIVEYKASTVKITEKVFDQIVRYNMVMGVEWLIVSNGLQHYCCQVFADGKYRFVKQLPPYPTIITGEP